MTLLCFKLLNHEQKMKHFYLLILASLMIVCSCEKEVVDPKDVMLKDIAGEYYLVDYNWNRALQIDIDNNGECTSDLLPVFSNWSNAGSYSFKVASNAGVYYGNGSVCIPTVLGNAPSSVYPGLAWLNFKFNVNSDGISFPPESLEILTPEVCSTKFSNPQMEFCYEHDSKDVRYLIITMDAQFYDYSTNDYVDGRVRMQFVTAPAISVENGLITAWGN